ncbi:CHAT domain-containing protein [Actinoallomurus sp. NPDC052308]|uniref:CHAT domain-containing tetratricopeptide repeat protein n=1 Tax=Actinoallomurus sp. NPDC052308 TaxID=3155530 RepID=UPI00342CF020
MGEREELRTGVGALLQQVVSAQDLSPVLERDALRRATRLTQLLRDDDGDLQSRYLLGWLHWYRYQALPDGQDQQDLAAAVGMLTPCFVADTAGLPEPLLPVLAHQATPTAEALLEYALGSGDQSVLDSAAGLWQRILAAAPADHPNRVAILANLASALQARFLRTATPADLDTAIDALRQAVETLPADHPYRGGMLSNLGNGLRLRFWRTGAPADLDTAIDTLRQAANLTPGDHPYRAGILANLGNALQARYGHTGALGDLDTAVDALRQATDAASADEPHRAERLASLGFALQARFERTGVESDLETAVEVSRQAVDVAPADHPDRTTYLSILGNALRARYEHTGVRADLDAAIDALRQATDAAPADEPNRATYLSILGNALRARYEHTEARADLDATIDTFRQATDAAPVDHPNRASMLFNLGATLRTRFEHTGAQADRDTALWAQASAAGLESAAPSTRVQAARAAAYLAAESQPGLAAGLVEDAVRLLPEVALRQLERADQEHAIGSSAGLAADAAALALADTTTPAPERAPRALRLLEAARAVLLSQALDTRSDLSELRDRHPELAARFSELRDLLDRPDDTSSSMGMLSDGIGAEAPERRTRDRHHVAEEFAAVMAEIREQDGFASFALPLTDEQLMAQATAGPVVAFNISSYRSDALLLTADGVTSLPLPALTFEAVTGRIDAFHQALYTTTDPDARAVDRVGAQAEIREILGWLWDNAAEPILSALGHHEPPPEGRPWPRLWWAPGGLLGMLPIHAAGHHTGPGRRSVMDRVVSSYTPTIGALRHARQRAGAGPRPRDHRALIVAMPTTPGLPGQGRLEQVPREAALVHAHLPRPLLLAEPGTPGDVAASAQEVPTKAVVLAHLPGRTIAHFACHGFTHPTDPSKSLLLLHDHRDDPLNVASLASVVLDHAQLAYLSACSTALTAEVTLLDEAIHLTSAFQLAGFPHVIGTLWQINDALAVTVADAFYTALRTSDGTLDTARSAHALHHAVRAARDAFPATPSLWAAYLHAGA